MSGLVLFAGVEVLLLVINVALIRKNERILKEIRRCNHDLAVALGLASQGRYGEAREAARRWADRMRAHMRGEPYRRPRPEPSAAPREDEWQGRFAP
jgi:hypothetical protein